MFLSYFDANSVVYFVFCAQVIDARLNIYFGLKRKNNIGNI